jgi:hypothetical protein
LSKTLDGALAREGLPVLASALGLTIGDLLLGFLRRQTPGWDASLGLDSARPMLLEKMNMYEGYGEQTAKDAAE